MAILPILEVPHPTLRAKAKPVEAVDDGVRRLLDDMLETMYAAPGIGLAAPQVGVGLRAFVLDLSKDEAAPAPVRLVNPEILWRADELVAREEGCLSIPEHWAEVRRPRAVKVRYLDEHGAEREVEGDGLLARCLQHELDHLDGILFVDHLTALKRGIILRKLAKTRRQRD